MAMQFNNNSGKKKYQCFVCGQLFEDFGEFKEHIINKHEEGREYVQCPLQRCLAPVRDLRLHFRAIHPSEDFKKVTGPTRAIIWKDFSPRGKAKTRKPKFRQGKYVSTKMNKAFTYRSGWECTVYECLDIDNDVMGFEVEPFEIDYIHKGKAHKYLPDLMVYFVDGHKELWEIKPSRQTDLQKNKDKWHFAEQACQNQGWTFQVITEQVIEKLKKKVQRQRKLND